MGWTENWSGIETRERIEKIDVVKRQASQNHDF